jgi:heptose I phosphotransferase
MDWPVTDRFHAKQGRSIGRLVLEAGGRRLSVYLKRHYRLPARHGWGARLWPWADWSPGVQELRHLQWAQAQGIPVGRPVAAGEWLGPGGQLSGFLAVEELDGMLPLHEAVPLAAARLDPPAFQAWKAGLATEMARLARMLHDRQHYHNDLYLCHYYVREADIDRPPTAWPGRLFLIDFHRLGHHTWLGPWFRLKDLAQLLYSSEVAGVGVRDRVRFWRAYCAGLGWSQRWRAWVRSAVVGRGGLYRRHNAKRKAGRTKGA